MDSKPFPPIGAILMALWGKGAGIPESIRPLLTSWNNVMMLDPRFWIGAVLVNTGISIRLKTKKPHRLAMRLLYPLFTPSLFPVLRLWNWLSQRPSSDSQAR